MYRIELVGDVNVRYNYSLSNPEQCAVAESLSRILNAVRETHYRCFSISFINVNCSSFSVSGAEIVLSEQLVAQKQTTQLNLNSRELSNYSLEDR